MKNREKFSDEILTAIKSGASCDFMKKTVIPLYIDSRESSDEFCDRNNCVGCTKLFAFWLNGEYEAPPTDWANVPVDTLVRVRHSVNGEWLLRYFKGIDTRGYCQPFETWADGATSVTAEGYTEHWEHCELAEDAAETERVNRWRMKN